MAIDPNIALQVKPLQLESPLARYAQVAQIQGMQGQNRLAELQMQAAEQAQAEDQATRQAFAESGGDQNALLRNLQKAGLYKPAQAIQKSMLEADEKRANIKRADAGAAKDIADAGLKAIDGQIRQFDIIGRLFNGVKDQAGYDAALAAASRYLPAEVVAKFEPTFDSVRLEQGRMQALSVKDQLEQQWKERAHQLEVEKFGETKRSNVADEAHKAGVLKVQQGQLGVSQGQLGVAQRREAREAADAARGVTYTTDGDGNLVAVPSKLPAGATSITPIGVLGPDGKPVAGKGSKPTEWEGKNALFGARAAEAHRLLNDLEKGGTTTPGLIKQGVEGVPLIGGALGMGVNALPGMLGGPSVPQQKVEQAQRDFINAILRLESGAAIGKEEFENARKQYFPQPGEGPEIVAQKRRARETAISGLQRNAGRFAYDAAPPAAPAPAGGPGGAPGGPPLGISPSAIDAELARRAGGR